VPPPPSASTDQQTPGDGHDVLLQAVVRPDHRGRTHPDPRADPPTQALDTTNMPTERLRQVGPDTDRIPLVADTDRIPTDRIPVVPVAVDDAPAARGENALTFPAGRRADVEVRSS
jgi:hypothetical protein